MSEWLGGSGESWSVVDVFWLGLIVSIVGLAASLVRSRALAGSPPRSGQDSAVEFLDRRAAYRERERILDHEGRPT